MGKTVEELKVIIRMPKSVLSANLTATQGNYKYDLASKVAVWDPVVGTFLSYLYNKISTFTVLTGIIS